VQRQLNEGSEIQGINEMLYDQIAKLENEISKFTIQCEEMQKLREEVIGVILS